MLLTIERPRQRAGSTLHCYLDPPRFTGQHIQHPAHLFHQPLEFQRVKRDRDKWQREGDQEGEVDDLDGAELDLQVFGVVA